MLLGFSLILPVLLQGLAMTVDEFHFHRRRGLGRWERIGHPFDTLSVLAAMGFLLAADFSLENAAIFAGLAAFSCLLITKDEWVHQAECAPAETWLHSLLFVLHPLALLSAGVLWYLRGLPGAARPDWAATVPEPLVALGLWMQLALIGFFLVWQITYWNGPWAKNRRTR